MLLSTCETIKNNKENTSALFCIFMVAMHRNGIKTYKWSMQIFLVFWLLTNRNKDNVLTCERTRIKSGEHHSFCFFSLMTKKRIDHRLDMKERK
jgi:hypothetical protein